MVSIFIFMAIALSLNGQPNENPCGNLFPLPEIPNIMDAPPPNSSCTKASEIYDFYKRKENFIPYSSVSSPLVANKKVKIRFLVTNPGTIEKLNFGINYTGLLKNMVEWMNGMAHTILAPDKPQTNICGDCYIKDLKIEFDLVGITFFSNTDTFTYATNFSSNLIDEDSVLNIFFCYKSLNAPGTWNGIANPLTF